MGTPAEKLLSPEAAQVLRQAAVLPAQERLQLADALRASVEHDDLTPVWHNEISQRAVAFERGELETVDGREVFARIASKYAR